MNHEERLRAFRASYPEKSLMVNGLEWSYRVCGEGSRTLLLLPGAELVNDLAFDLVGTLAPRFRILYPAYPRAKSLEDLADGVAAILETEKAERVWVLGTSFGGAVTQCLVRRHGDRLERLILSNTGVPQQHVVRTRKVVNAVLAMIPWPASRVLLIRSLTKALGAPAGDVPFWRSYFEELFRTRLTKADVLSNLKNQLEYHVRYHFSSRDLASWDGKIFVIESDNDLFGPARRQALREAYPEAQVHTFHDAGNAPAISRPDEYGAVLDRFLA